MARAKMRPLTKGRNPRKSYPVGRTVRVEGVTVSIGIPMPCPHCGGQIQPGMTPTAFPDRDHAKIKAIYAAADLERLTELNQQAVALWLKTSHGRAYLRKAAIQPGSPYKVAK